MKKLAIVGASAALAAMPVVGVFAVDGDGNMTTTDTVQITINNACSLTTSGNTNAFSDTMTNSQLKSDFGSTTMTITCNDAGGWKVTAVGNGDDATDKTAMNASSTGTDIATGTATSGATSNWAMQVTGTGATGFTTFAGVSSSATKVAEGNNSVSGGTLTTTYQVWVSATQQADTYTGKVLYTLVHPNPTS